MLDYGNTLDEIMKAFGLSILSERDWEEFKIFWNSLNEGERISYRRAKLS